MSHPPGRLKTLGHGPAPLWSILLGVVSFLSPGRTMSAQVPAVAPTSATGASSPDAQHVAEIERRLSEVSAALAETSEAVQKYESEVRILRAELAALKLKDNNGAASGQEDVNSASELPGSNPEAMANLDALRALHDEQVAQQAEIQQLDQIKVETSSKYPLRISGLVLFNAFANAGVVDNAELPAVALYRYPGSSHGSNGATLRQTRLGLQAFGPRFAGASTSAELSVDFFGGPATNASGYSASAGTLRMRQAMVTLNWERTTIAAGYTGPLISPLSPASFATVAAPSLSGSGNLWTWSPQLSIEQRIPLSDSQSIGLEAGLIYPSSPGYTSAQLVSPIDASRRPAYEGRVSYRGATASTSTEDRLTVGMSGYSGEQFYDSNTRIHSWAVAGDWDIPIARRAELSGEIYRGKAIGGLGGGAYKDIINGIDTTTGLARTAAVDAAGGWAQVKLRFARSLESNAIFGIDDALSRSFEGLILESTTDPLVAYARNSSIIGNLVYRPLTYLVISPEYRRITSWRYTGSPNVANIFTISAGYQF